MVGTHLGCVLCGFAHLWYFPVGIPVIPLGSGTTYVMIIHNKHLKPYLFWWPASTLKWPSLPGHLLLTVSQPNLCTGLAAPPPSCSLGPLPPAAALHRPGYPQWKPGERLFACPVPSHHWPSLSDLISCILLSSLFLTYPIISSCSCTPLSNSPNGLYTCLKKKSKIIPVFQDLLPSQVKPPSLSPDLPETWNLSFLGRLI